MSNYSLLPFNFEKTDSNYLLTNDIGEYLLLSELDFKRFIEKKITTDENLYLDLESRFFATQEISQQLVNHYATRYRTKKRFVYDSTFLHMIVVTHRCNQNCLYCHASAAKEDAVEELDLSIETAERIVDSILSTPSKHLKIEFQGGEPLLNLDVIKHIVLYAKEHCSNDKKLDFVICSNLIALTNDHIDFILEHQIDVSTSLDGTQPLHDSCRKKHDGTGTYAAVSASLNKAKELGISNISALLTVHKKNIFSLQDVINEYVSRDFKSIFIRGLNPYGNAKSNYDEVACNNDEFFNCYIAALDYIIEINRKGIDLVEEFTAILLSRILSPFANGFVDIQSPTGGAICGMMYETNGDVFVSDEARMLHRMIKNTNFLLGNVSNSSRYDWFFTEKMKSYLECSVIESLPGCAWCAFAPYCGTDPVRNYFETGNTISIKTLDKQCQLNKRIFIHLFKLLHSSDSFTQRLLWSWATRG
ncbi:His-Xaa-Ser system radical SAM maturase HxsB [Halodesulfovibrio sp.]|uniref:His-Xaa-Ser system radical SAM maturase HxsB n=1 Tax=Halodesulfovibrio sp. TaxID=1912772 RepID=UPI0025C0C672|nr:His-Xaa-Ser system radical SAM maturase HxsB [Halodesulfovibrio sp.]